MLSDSGHSRSLYENDCHNITEVDKQLNLVVPLQNVCVSVKWQIYKSLKTNI